MSCCNDAADERTSTVTIQDDANGCCASSGPESGKSSCCSSSVS